MSSIKTVEQQTSARLKYSASCSVKKTTASDNLSENSASSIGQKQVSSSSRTKQVINRSVLVNNQTSVGSLSNLKKRQPALLSHRDKTNPSNMSNTSAYYSTNGSYFNNQQQQQHSAMMPSVASRLKKNIARTKEKILQGMGKTDRTSDQCFDHYVDNFEHQYTQANKLNKELNKYLHCLKETQKSSKVFYDTLKETYETNWPGSNLFYEQIQLMELKWSEYLNKLINQVQLPLMGYLSEFPEYKKRIEKRANRLLDYDDARHTLEGAQNKSAKKHSLSSSASNTANGTNANSHHGNTSTSTSTNNSSSSSSNTTATTEHLTKLTKLKIDLEDKQNIYEEINQNLCTTLPVLFADRIKFYASLFQSFFHSENIFHSDCVEIKAKLDDICENLSIKSQVSCEQFKTINVNNVEAQIQQKIKNLELESQAELLKASNQTPNLNVKNNANNAKLEKVQEKQVNGKTEFVPTENKNINELNSSVICGGADTGKSQKQPDEANGEDGAQAVFSCLYRVKATYAYEAKEVDELTFAKDELISVVEGTESEKEDLDEGWQIGIHEPSSRRGLFPENFTKRI